ncbi:F-box/LRR-repeat protein 7 [Hondaea fermentalgiana]|uniref:F-box/LRR-repeat protein 7 n=1 Tax=Hondaea fermentalgiana TaxID=2315210 RepID=A0A2R5GAQ4_9STRA|nr:F-box/LRR-repeat protein 7 [Hondaea fermentalgiana]|eukprot:GBG26818.1 F-box/LRR-repeat protein 7 [Hondaea fermentalgiana]
MPSQIAFTAPVTGACNDATQPALASFADRATRSISVPSRPPPSSLLEAESDYARTAAETLLAVQDHDLVYSPLSLVDLCMRTLCQHTEDWVARDGTPRMNLRALPKEIALQLFEMARKHKLLREDILAAFHRCEITEVRLAQYPGITDNWLPDMTRLVGLRILDLSHCTSITDEGLRSIGALGFGKGVLEVLRLESCVALTDASVAFVVSALSNTLRELNLSGCPRLTDATLARIIMAKELRTLNLNRCQLFTPVYLCQLALLCNLRSLNVGLIPNVDHNVLSAFRPSLQRGAPLLLDAIVRCYDATDHSFFPRQQRQALSIEAVFQDNDSYRSMASFFESDDDDIEEENDSDEDATLVEEVGHVHGLVEDPRTNSRLRDPIHSSASDLEDARGYADAGFVMESDEFDISDDNSDPRSSSSRSSTSSATALSAMSSRRVSLNSMLSSPLSGSTRTLSLSPQSTAFSHDDHDAEETSSLRLQRQEPRGDQGSGARATSSLESEEEPTMESLGHELRGGSPQPQHQLPSQSSQGSSPDPFLRRVLRPLKSSGSMSRRRSAWKLRKSRARQDSYSSLASSSTSPNLDTGASVKTFSSSSGSCPSIVSTLTRAPYDLATISSQFENADRCGLYNLEHLDAGFCSVDDLGAQHLSCLRNLRSLVLAQNPITAAAVPCLTQLVALEHLDVTQCSSLGNGAAQLLSLPSLKSLSLEYVPVVRLADDENFGQLQELNLSNTSVDDRSLAILAKRARSLRSLKLESCRITASGLAHLVALVHLHTLDLSETDLDDDSMRHVAVLPALVDLNLFQSGVSDAGVSILAQRLYSLERLNIDTGDISGPCLLRLRSLRNLKHLDLFGAHVTDRGCRDLMAAGLAHLESLEICGGLITNTGVSHLCSMRAKLKRLNLSQNAGIGDEAVKCLAQAFGMSMRSLSLSGTRITKRSITLMYSFVYLEELVVRGCKLPIFRAHGVSDKARVTVGRATMASALCVVHKAMTATMTTNALAAPPDTIVRTGTLSWSESSSTSSVSPSELG